MPRMTPMLVTLLLSGVLVGCKDSPTEPAEPLNEAEAEALFLGLFAVAGDTMQVPRTGDTRRLAFVCPRGGEMATSVNYRPGVGGGTNYTILELDPAECVVLSEGYLFTMDGSPNVRMEMLSSVGDSETFEVEMTVTGALDWQLDERSGNCVFDLSMKLALDPSNIETPKAETSGTICGLEVTWDPPIPPV